MPPLSPRFLDLLRGTLHRLQRAIDLDPDDSSLQQLKSSILRSVAELELKKSQTAPRSRVVQILQPPVEYGSSEKSEWVAEDTDAA